MQRRKQLKGLLRKSRLQSFSCVCVYIYIYIYIEREREREREREDIESKFWCSIRKPAGMETHINFHSICYGK
jgi:hypothetical protein